MSCCFLCGGLIKRWILKLFKVLKFLLFVKFILTFYLSYSHSHSRVQQSRFAYGEVLCIWVTGRERISIPGKTSSKYLVTKQWHCSKIHFFCCCFCQNFVPINNIYLVGKGPLKSWFSFKKQEIISNYFSHFQGIFLSCVEHFKTTVKKWPYDDGKNLIVTFNIVVNTK